MVGLPRVSTVELMPRPEDVDMPFLVRPEDKPHFPPPQTRKGRDRRRENREALADGTASLSVVLNRTSAEWQPIGELIAALPGYGPVRTEKTLRAAGLAPWLRAGDLTDGQRERLEEAVGDA